MCYNLTKFQIPVNKVIGGLFGGVQSDQHGPHVPRPVSGCGPARLQNCQGSETTPGTLSAVGCWRKWTPVPVQTRHSHVRT